MFQYDRFEEDINDVPPNGFFETRPEVNPADTNPFNKYQLSGTVAATASALMPKAQLPEKEAAEVERIVETARYESHSRAIVLAQYIRQYDHSGRGVVTQSQFLREFMNYFKTLSTEDAMLLAKAYSTSDGQVRYMACCRDITPEVFDSHRSGGNPGRMVINNFEVSHLPSSSIHLESGKRGASPNAKLERTLSKGAGQGAAPKVLEATIRLVYERRINIANIFSDFDKLNRHRITRPQFVRALASLGMNNVEPAELEAFANRYVDEADASGNMVKYRDFVEEVNCAFFLPRLEKDPLKVNDTFAATVVHSPSTRDKRPALSVEDETVYHVAMEEIKGSVIRLSAYNLGAGLRDFDKLGEGYITIDRFFRVLAMYSLVPQGENERRVVLEKFRGSGFRREMIEYRSFLREINLE
jgi:Ca2+-binding EF-hand superfamily protein